MKLSKKLILTITGAQLVFVIAIFILYTIENQKSLGIMELLFFAFISLVIAFFMNILVITIVQIMKIILDK